MPPRIRLRPRSAVTRLRIAPQRCHYAAVATAITPAPSIEQTIHSVPPIARYPVTQPPSHKPPEFRKSQLHRQYTSILRSSPLILLFQHNNLKAVEWMAIRREMAHALRKVDEERVKSGLQDANFDSTESIKIQIVQTGIFGAALRVVEFWNPNTAPVAETSQPQDPKTNSSASGIKNTIPAANDPTFSHGLSKAAYQTASNKKLRHDLEPLLSGPVAAVTFPSVSPQHLKAVLQILSPNKEFPGPKRKVRPMYHEPAVQSGLQKLLLLAARVEGKVFDQSGVRWMGGIEGGLEGLRAQLVAVLQGAGASVTSTLEAASKALYFTMEGRKGQLEEEQKGESEGKKDGTPPT